MDKKIPWWIPKMEKEDLEFIRQAIGNNFINDGPLTAELENKMARLLGVKHALVVNSGTVAIFMALKGLNIGRDDEVIVPDATFIATANAVDLCGATPVLVDINPQTLNIDPEAVKKAITKKTRAILPVHVTGRAAAMNKILSIAKENNLFVVEDAAEAFGSKYQKKYLGTLGNAGCFSFSPNKTVTTGQGGMIVTNDDALFARLKTLKYQGLPEKGTGGDEIYDIIGYNFKFTDLQAGVGLGQLMHFEERVERMKRNYLLYAENLKNIPEVEIFPSADGEIPQWTDITTDKRDALEQRLRERNMSCRKYWRPIHRQPAYKLPDDNFPVSIKVLPKSLWLPSAFTLTDEDVFAVCGEIKKFFKVLT